MRTKIYLILIVLALAVTDSMYAQTTTISNSFTTGAYLGWNSSTAVPLVIKHENTQDIIFSINGQDLMGIDADGRFVHANPNVFLNSLGQFRAFGSFESAVRGNVEATGTENIGGLFIAERAPNNRGLYGFSTDVNTSEGGRNIGVHGKACSDDENITAYGIYGRSECEGVSFALWLNGPSHCTSQVWSSSDELLKTDIADIESPGGILAGIYGYQYEFLQDLPINLPHGIQFGVLAQEVQNSMPNAVTDVRSPEITDDNGFTITESIQYKAVNYEQFISLLIAEYKNQQATLSQQEQTLQQLQSQLELLESTLSHY